MAVLADAGFGLYLHWPFCQAKCPYCDFNSHVVPDVEQDRWAAAFETEIDRIADETSDRILQSVFFGGGTPSLMEVSTVERIMDRIQRRWRLANTFEVTLEANPTSTEAARFRGYRAAGVNRVSVGVQALNDADLKALGRLHSAAEALDAVALARETFDRVSFDLIYARQHQSVAEWEAELSRALSFDPDHLSLYQLTIEDGTAFGARFKRGLLRGLPDEDRGADLFELTQTMCRVAGLPAYEVSNHAKSGEEGRHNLIYWRSGDWAGIGPGAHGRLTLDGVRYETISPKAPGAWLAQVEQAQTGENPRHALNPADILEERLMMGLRLVEGITMPEAWLEKKSRVINDLSRSGLIVQSNRVIRATDAGRPLLNAVLSELLTD